MAAVDDWRRHHPDLPPRGMSKSVLDGGEKEGQAGAEEMSGRSIYVIRSKLGPVKIGVARNARNRLSQLRTSSHVPLFLDYAAAVDSDVLVLEGRVHKALMAALYPASGSRPTHPLRRPPSSKRLLILAMPSTSRTNYRQPQCLLPR
jgi:T5orf172 domain